MKSATFIRSTVKGGDHHIEVVHTTGEVSRYTQETAQLLADTQEFVLDNYEKANLLKTALIDWQNWIDKHPVEQLEEQDEPGTIQGYPETVTCNNCGEYASNIVMINRGKLLMFDDIQSICSICGCSQHREGRTIQL